jgi:hypothetical protein
MGVYVDDRPAVAQFTHHFFASSTRSSALTSISFSTLAITLTSAKPRAQRGSSGRLVVAEQFAHSADGSVELIEVVVDCGLNDGVVGVPVAMRKMVTHPRDQAPRDARLLSEQASRERFDRFTDLKQADADGIEDQAVV